MKIFFLMIILLLLSSHVPLCNSQSNINNGIVVEKYSSSYLINGSEIISIILSILNTGPEPIWLWLDKEELTADADSIIINRYFLQKKEGSDGSLLQIAMDYNIESYTPAIFSGFIKRIPPSATFYIQVLSHSIITNEEIQNILTIIERHTVYYSQSYLEKHVPLISNFNQMILYKPNLITLPKELLLNLVKPMPVDINK